MGTRSPTASITIWASSTAASASIFGGSVTSSGYRNFHAYSVSGAARFRRSSNLIDVPDAGRHSFGARRAGEVRLDSLPHGRNFNRPLASMQGGNWGVEALLRGSWSPLIDASGHLVTESARDSR